MILLRALLGAIVLSLLLARPVSGLSARPGDSVFPTIAIPAEGG